MTLSNVESEMRIYSIHKCDHDPSVATPFGILLPSLN